ncbi:MAG: tRNA uridine(34) 5-carboxymethylaminomethyl modification radical SAM/GNAT enzyme Elp3 [archaeon]
MLIPKKNEVRKPTKTISGITPLAVMLPPRKCDHGSCVYCPNLNVPQSYTPKSPVVLRASKVNYNAFKQAKARLESFKLMNHPTEKVELIIMGGTFLEYPKQFQYKFIRELYDALNNKKSKSLKKAQKLNEKSKHRCVALCIETRPDVCIEYIDRMREFGCTRVELGVQIIDDVVYKKIKRGHSVNEVIDATKKLKDAGFKIGYHIMPNLPGSNLKKDIKLFKKLFSSQDFKPDQLKLYPCQVIPGAELEKLYWNKKYKPYSKEETEKILIQMLKQVPRYCRVMRVMREIPPEYLVAGTTKIDLRKDIEEELRKKNSKLKEIRYREIGFALRDKRKVNLDLKLKITKYKASKGEEYFLEIVNKQDILFGLLRLRMNIGQAIIRELHVYGQSLKLGEKGKLGQHTGLGKWLMSGAEKIAKENRIKKLSVISGVGVREYYRRLGYKLEDTYMVKNIKV